MRTEDQTPRLRLADRLGVASHDLYHQVFDSESARLATLGKMSAQEHWEAVREALDQPAEGFSEVVDSFWDGDRLDLVLIDALRDIRLICKTALLSNAWDDLRGYIENERLFADAFDELIISAEEGVAKPDPRIYQVAMDRLDVLPHQVIFVDDVITNVEAARDTGMLAIHFQESAQTRDALKRFLNLR